MLRFLHDTDVDFGFTVGIGQFRARINLLTLLVEHDSPQPPGERRCFTSSQFAGWSYCRHCFVHFLMFPSVRTSLFTRFCASTLGHAFSVLVWLISAFVTQLNAVRILPMLSAEQDPPHPLGDRSCISSSQLAGSVRQESTQRRMSSFCKRDSMVLALGVCSGRGCFVFSGAVTGAGTSGVAIV